MVKIVSAHLANGQVIPDEPLPSEDNVEKVSILLEIRRSDLLPSESTVDKWFGILKGSSDDPKEDYHRYLEKKYL